MLIYVNQFEILGHDSFSVALRTIAGWLKTVTKQHFTRDMLLSGEEFSFEKTKVRTFAASELAPAIYSILLSHPDRTVRGRQWITELGIKYEGDITTVSVLLETSDISTLVKDIPSTTRPKLVSFLLKNANLNPKTTVGLRTQKLKNNLDDFKALSFEVERSERNYPLVFVSNCKKDNQPLVDPNRLQEQLVGLAQVVYSEEEIDSWELEGVLTRQYSAWDGAINIIYPSFSRGYCYSRLLLRDTLTDVIQSNENLIQHVLSYITHTTNGYNKKRHFSPTDVRAKRQKDSRVQLKKRFVELSNDSEYQALAEEAFSQLEEQENVIEQLKEKYEYEINEQMLATIEAQEQLDKSKSDYHVLKLRFDDLQGNSSKKGNPILIFGNEKEKFKGEITDLVLDALNEYAKSQQANSRKRQLLNDVLENNSIDGTRERIIEELKQVFNNYNGVTSSMKSSLKAMGLEVVEDGNHNHLRFIDDNRYKVAFAKTPSDKRVGANIIRDIKAAII
ncbi:hypothetical protein SAMN05421831_10749 [Allopseudospirillum japonicum]|uniref:Uncharacterized protein n=1 Tax=Allopseudospirillum japonicum TaxID=64971 RepID=A0A1H6SHH5_9GAMM|nr:hypothetical protein [Allopseudospirillum japonicum]SEI67419.1 hypothetical protein SAMN05421831_10749 [Allopseudospirillum japonicum]